MSTPTNKERMAAAMDALSRGDGKPLLAAMADDMVWRIGGTTAWSGDYVGKADVLGRLMKSLFAQFATTYTNTPHRIVAEGDIVVVECRGDVTTRSGKPYCNRYCYVSRWADGQMRELTEYLDTALVDEALEPPPWAQPLP